MKRHAAYSIIVFASLMFARSNFLSSPSVYAACINTGTNVTCDAVVPYSHTVIVDTGPADHRKVAIVKDDSIISTDDFIGISLSDNATIILESGSVVTNIANSLTPSKYDNGIITI